MDNYSVRQNKIEHSLDELFFNSYISAAQGAWLKAGKQAVSSLSLNLTPCALRQDK
jgi:hypothetical protein